ncbi:hypothetical protein Tco_1097160, partial [Tanacetum coccineum]
MGYAVTPSCKSLMLNFLQNHVYLINELCGHVLWKPSRDFTRPLEPPSGLKGLFHTLNATVIPTKLYSRPPLTGNPGSAPGGSKIEMRYVGVWLEYV